MRSSVARLLLAVLAIAALAVAALSVAPGAADARGHSCGKLKLTAASATVKVRIDRGSIRCKKARRLLRRYDATGAANPTVNRGWFCFAGRQGDRYLLGCQTAPRKRVIVRGYR